MPRWFLALVALVALAYAGLITVLYVRERDKAEVTRKATYDTKYLEAALPQTVDAKREGELTGVLCVRRSRTAFRCVGDFVPSLAAIHEQADGDPAYGGSPLTEREARTLQKRSSERLGYDVTLDPETGKFVTKSD